MNLKKKLAVFLAILFSLNLFAQAPGETITISFQNIPLSEAIKKIESVSKYTFFYDALKLNVDQNGYLPSCCFAHKKNEIRKEYDHR